MQSCLGIYIEQNVIKYAKLQKEKDAVKIESYNIEFYDENNLEETLRRIVSETYSYKVPISINVSDEIYSTFQISSLLNKQDTKKAVNIEYEMLCNERGYNKSSLEHKYIINFPRENHEIQKILSVIARKDDISKKTKALDGYKIETITPITTSITNLVDYDGRKNIAIVNIEERTKVTTLIDGQIYQIDLLEDGMGKILDNINKTENSYSKSYEVCKNMTLYTQGSADLYSENSEYMDMTSSILLNIATEVKKILSEMFSSIDTVYITGLGTCINNIDLYFQEYISSSKCEILKPYFLNTSALQAPIKEQIEVNSAIALALDGLGMVEKDLNYSKSAKLSSSNSKLSSFLNQEITPATVKEAFVALIEKTKHDFSVPFSSSEKLITRGIASCIMIAVIFTIFSFFVSNQLESKAKEVQIATEKVSKETNKLDSDIKVISSRTDTYETLIKEITSPPEEKQENNKGSKRIIQKDSIPNLLNRIMFVIPKKVKLNSIQNTNENHIVINAEAEKYEQLGYFKAVLTNNGILENVKSTSGEKSGSTVQVKIEGDLP